MAVVLRKQHAELAARLEPLRPVLVASSLASGIDGRAKGSALLQMLLFADVMEIPTLRSIGVRGWVV